MLSPTTQRAESKGNRWHPRDLIAVSAVQTRPSTESKALLTNQIRTCGSYRSRKDVVMLFCPSFTQSARFLHTDQLITRLRRVEYTATCYSHDKLHAHVIGKRVRERVQVRSSVLVGSDLPHPSSMFDRKLHLSKSQGSYGEPLEESQFREAISNFLTVTMHLQDALTRFHRPGLHKVDLRVHVASASTRTLAFHETQSCCAVRAQNNRPR